MDSKHIEVENKKTDKVSQKQYVLCYIKEDNTPVNFVILLNKEAAAKKIYEVIQQEGARNIKIFVETPYKIQL